MVDIKNDFKKYAIYSRNVNSLTVDKYMDMYNNCTQSVIEERTTNFREIDVFSRLIMDRIIFLGSEINNEIANVIVAQMLYLDSIENSEISLYINSPGGEVYAGFSIYDTMNFVKSSVTTVCTGLSASMAAVLLAGGTKGKRYALKHSRIMIHQPLGGAKGQASDMEITLRQVVAVKKEIYEILAERTGKSYNTIEKDSDRDYWMTAKEAKDYGIVDIICESKNV